MPERARNGVERRLVVSGVESAAPFVRVTCWFHEGGTPHRSHQRNTMTFLCRDHEQPRIGQELTMTIRGLP